MGINNLDELLTYDYLKVFQWLVALYPSLGYKALFDLYTMSHHLPINSLNKETKLNLKTSYKNLLPSYMPLPTTAIDKYLTIAKSLILETSSEVPIGAIIIKEDKIIASGVNQTQSTHNITCHAEIMAINNAAKALGTFRLDKCDLYVTIEPCLMCIGAILHSRIRRVVFGAIEPNTGAIISQYQVLDNKAVNKQT